MENETTGVAEPKVETPTEQAEETPTSEEADELPSDPAKQREAFIKMRQEIKELKNQKTENTSVRDEIEIPDEITQQLGEEITSDTTVDQIVSQLEFTKRAAIEAMRETQQLRQERENAALYKEFPQLDPQGNEFDPNLDRLVAEKYFFNAQQGKKISPVDAARLVNEDLKILLDKTREQAKQETKESIERREHASLEATGSAAQGVRDKTSISPDQLESIRDRVRRGDRDAQIEYDKILFGN